MNLASRIVMLVLAIILTFVALYTQMPPDPNKYIAAINDKHKLLIATESPKIVLIGGSNLAFGIDSKLIEKKMKVNVVNMGLHHGIGLRYMLEHVKNFLYRNDIVIIAAEYDLFYDGGWKGKKALTEALSEFPRGIQYISSIKDIDFTTLFRALQVRIWKYLKLRSCEEKEVYNRRAFNDNGDLISHLGKETNFDSVRNASFSFSGKIDDYAVGVINEFYSFCQEQGVICFLSFPPLSTRQYIASEDEIINLAEELKETVLVQVISDPRDYIFPLEFFFDTGYHLNAAGRKVRTGKLIGDISTAMNSRQMCNLIK